MTTTRDEGSKTEQAHWEAGNQIAVRRRLPSRLNVGVLNLTTLLQKHVKPGHKYLEIGCAPGKMLAWVAATLKAEVSGLDYSRPGISTCRTLFDALGLKCDLHEGDFFKCDLPQS